MQSIEIAHQPNRNIFRIFLWHAINSQRPHDFIGTSSDNLQTCWARLAVQSCDLDRFLGINGQETRLLAHSLYEQKNKTIYSCRNFEENITYNIEFAVNRSLFPLKQLRRRHRLYGIYRRRFHRRRLHRLYPRRHLHHRRFHIHFLRQHMQINIYFAE